MLVYFNKLYLELQPELNMAFNIKGTAPLRRAYQAELVLSFNVFIEPSGYFIKSSDAV